jgi:hypothetical protein
MYRKTAALCVWTTAISAEVEICAIALGAATSKVKSLIS